MVLRRYMATSRTCDSISPHGRWLLESCIVPRDSGYRSELHYGFDIAVGDVEPGWCIVYAGHELWFPQRVLRVDHLSRTWQRVWTLGDARTRDVWDSDQTYVWDNGHATNWSYDEVSWPRWRDSGPWWPLQPEPLSPDTRRFVLGKFGIAGECPRCGAFGKRMMFGVPGDPSTPDVIFGGCETTPDSHDFGCECGFRWSLSTQGQVCEAGSSAEPAMDPRVVDQAAIEADGELNYYYDDQYPYGAAEENFMELKYTLLEEAGGEVEGIECYSYELLVHYLGHDEADRIIDDTMPYSDWSAEDDF